MKHSEMALIANESEDVVFEEREWSLDFLLLLHQPKAEAELTNTTENKVK